MTETEIEVRSNAHAITYVKLINGQELLAEVFTLETHNRKAATREITLYRPLCIQNVFDQVKQINKIVTYPYINMMISEEESVVIDEKNIMFMTPKVNEMMINVYYQNWTQMLDENYIESEDGQAVDEDGNPMEIPSDPEDLPKIEEEKPEKELPSIVFEGQKKTLQ